MAMNDSTKLSTAPARPRRSALFTGAAGLALFAGTGTAFATAYGFDKIDGFCYPIDAKGIELCIPAATIAHGIEGDDRTIVSESAEVSDILGAGTGGGQWCNWHIDWNYYDDNGLLYYVDSGPMHNTCDGWSAVSRVDQRARTLPYYGAACAAFYVGGEMRGRQCHHITQ
jgi:hypothetical protein